MLRKVYDILKKVGAWVFNRKVSQKLIRPLFDCETNVVFEKDLTNIKHYPIKADIRISLLSPNELHLLIDDELDYHERDLVKASSWLAKGDKCFVGYVKNKISCYVWVNLKERILAGDYRLPLGENKAYMFKAFTIHSRRGLGLLPAVGTAAYTWLRQNGYRFVYSEVNIKNRPSLKIHQKIGLRVVGRFRILRILKWKWVILPSRLRETISN